MPLLVVYSRFSLDSKVLRRAAQALGWETLRLEGRQLPDWVDVEEPDVAIFATMPEAQRIAEGFSRILLGCGAHWLPGPPQEFRQRQIELMPLREALTVSEGRFLKSAITKHLAGKFWTRDELLRETDRLHPDFLIQVAEPVEFLIEYRCFVAEGRIVTMSPYRRFGSLFDDARPTMDEPPEEAVAAQSFAQSVLASVACPPAFVLDVGYINARGWAVVEANECWASGIYHCDPAKVLAVLRKACVPAGARSAAIDAWDFFKHYAEAVPQ